MPLTKFSPMSSNQLRAKQDLTFRFSVVKHVTSVDYA